MALYRQAIEVAQRRVALNPRDVEARASLADYYAKAGERDKALEQIRRLPADETDPHVLVFAAVVYMDLGDRAAALTLLERASGHGLAANELRDWIELDRLKDEPRFAALIR